MSSFTFLDVRVGESGNGTFGDEMLLKHPFAERSEPLGVIVPGAGRFLAVKPDKVQELINDVRFQLIYR